MLFSFEEFKYDVKYDNNSVKTEKVTVAKIKIELLLIKSNLLLWIMINQF